MNFKTPYTEIKKWFEDNLEKLPDELNGEYRIYVDVKFTVCLIIERLDKLIEKHGSKVKNIKSAQYDKELLIEIWNDLQNND